MTSATPEYTPNIPQPKNIIGNSQDQFLQNFQVLYDAFAANHVPLDALSEAGNHTVIQLAEQTKNIQTNNNEISMYARNVNGQTDQLFMQYEGNQPEFQFSNYQTHVFHEANVQTTFVTSLPGKLIVLFGLVAASGTLDLEPYVIKNIASATFCAAGTTPLNSPFTALVKTGDFYTSIVIPKNAYYFLVVGNT